jgi:tetratricopeptide (TPR) repeat protein/transposase
MKVSREKNKRLTNGFNYGIMFPHMSNINTKLRLKAVTHYLNTEDSLRTTASRFHISYRALHKWVKWYKKDGKKRLLSTYKRPWNRCSKMLEKKVIALKEAKPYLTLRKTREILEREGILLSLKGIWGIWKRYGYAGFRKESLSNDFTEHCIWTKEALHRFEQAKKLHTFGHMEQSAEILNSIPFLPRNELLFKIPNEHLNRRRIIEKKLGSFGRVAIHPYMEELQTLIEDCRKENLRYSMTRLGVLESMALSWDAKPMEQLHKAEELLDALKKKKDGNSYLLFTLRFTLLISKGIAFVLLSKIEKAFQVARACNRVLKKRRHVSVNLMLDMGNLFAFLEDKAKAEFWYRKCMEKADEKKKEQVRNYLADIIFFKGEYRKALAIVKKVNVEEWSLYARVHLFRSMDYLSKGKPQKAIALSIRTLDRLKKESLHGGITAAYSILASSYSSLGDRQKAVNILKRLRPFLKKYSLQRLLERMLLLTTDPDKSYQSSYRHEDLLPVDKLIHLLRRDEYRKAYHFAHRKGIVSELHRYIFFFPWVITKLLDRGKSTGLPAAMVRLPVFNRERPLYHIKLLGPLVVHKEGRYLKTKITPKVSSFLIAIALKAGEPGKKIPLQALLDNYWKKSANPSRNLTHLLVELRKILKMPSHLFEVSLRTGNLINRGVHFTTDYGEFREGIAQAKAFRRAGEWDFARKEFLRAFSLFRGEPFRKMYDNWSDDTRLEILFLFEKEMGNFIEILFTKGRKADARRMEQKAMRILGSGGCGVMLESGI